ncbi:MAG: hypothetical protein ACRDG4_04685 [Chloroflexota bacterium]
MSFPARLTMAIVVAVALTIVAGGREVHASRPTLRLLHEGRPIRVLVPGASVVAVATGLDANRVRYCLGLANLADHYAIPVTLGAFRAADDGVMLALARVPLNVFPAEPIGSFVLFVGRCTKVAPSGNFAAAVVTIEPGLG